jgi:hypothetical protein
VPNTLLTPQVITHELLRRFKNNLGFAGSIRHEYDERFAQKGAKIGDSLQLRVPVKFTATKSATLTEQDVTETSVTLTLTTQAHVGFSFSSKDLTLTIDRFGERYLDSAAVALANVVDVDGLTMAYQSTFNAVGTPGTVPNALKTYNLAGAKLDNNGAPLDDMRSVVFNAAMQVEIVDSLKGLFQSTPQIKRQYEKGRMGTAAGFDWILDQNTRTHQVGPLGGTPQVNGASQTGANLVTNGWTASAANRLKKGDIFTIANVFAVNPVSGDTLSDLQQFVVTADVNSDGSGNATIPISPSIIPTGAYKTVSASPANGAAITVLGSANTLTPQGLAYHRDAFAMAMAPLEMPQGVHMAARSIDKESGMSIRCIGAYDIVNDKFIYRCDILYGWVAARPQFSCRIAS